MTTFIATKRRTLTRTIRDHARIGTPSLTVIVTQVDLIANWVDAGASND
jgi:hypothetical protein